MRHAWEKREKCTRCWWGKPEGKRLPGRPRRRWEVGIRMDIRETGWGGRWIGFNWLMIGTGVELL
jgi:hypothetical protein